MNSSSSKKVLKPMVRLGTIASAMGVTVLAVAPGTVFAATSSASTVAKSATRAQQTVRAEVNGKPVQAIAVGEDTYVNWGALQMLNTPYEYLGSGKFAVTGGTVQGVIYRGATYLPWNQLASSVKATKLPSGGFNFTANPVAHHYQVLAQGQDGPVGSPLPIEVLVADGDQPVPNQQITVKVVSGNATLTGAEAGAKLESGWTDDSGTWTGALNDSQAETVKLDVRWVTPAGSSVDQQVTVHFQAQDTTSSTGAVTVSGEKNVVTLPITTLDNAILFNAQSGNNSLLLQLDTGAYEPLLTKHDADLLHLPNLGSIAVQGVGGQDQAYQSRITLSIGGVTFKDIPCIVDESYRGVSLFGYGFFTGNGYDLFVSQKNQTLSILQ